MYKNLKLSNRSIEAFKKALKYATRITIMLPNLGTLIFQKLMQLISPQLTASLVKPLAFPRPTGHNLILEWDIFYPLPSSWRVPKPPPPPPPPTTTTEAIEVFDPHDHDHDPHDHDHDPHDHDSGPIWMPDSGWTSDVVEKLNDDPAEKRFWNAPRVSLLNEIFIDFIVSIMHSNSHNKPAAVNGPEIIYSENLRHRQ